MKVIAHTLCMRIRGNPILDEFKIQHIMKGLPLLERKSFELSLTG